MCFSNKVVLLVITGYFCGKMLNFVNFKNGRTCVHWHILEVMFRVLSNCLMSKLTDTSAYLEM